MNQFGVPDPVYVRARRALLDALQALGPHREAVVLVGAQAVYLHVGEAQEALSSFTIDADLALNPVNLSDEPALEAVLDVAGFRRKEQPGLWFTPDDVSDDHRSFVIAVAGPAALLIAKLHKIGERVDRTPDRLKNKDASDLFLLLRSTQTATMAAALQWLRETPGTSEATSTALRYLGELFASEAGAGVRLLRAAVVGIEDEETVVQSCIVLTGDLLDALV